MWHQNYCELELSENRRKQNAFLPWTRTLISTSSAYEYLRMAGDLCLFLDPDTHKWVLAEFKGDWCSTKRLSVFTGRGQPNSSRDQTSDAGESRRGQKPTAKTTREKILSFAQVGRKR